MDMRNLVIILLVAPLPACTAHRLPRETDYPGSGVGLIKTQGVRNPAVPYTIGNVQRGRWVDDSGPTISNQGDSYGQQGT